MVRALDRKLLRDIVHSKGMLAAIVSIIAVGAGCLAGMLSVADNLSRARESFYFDCRMADFWVELKRAPANEVVAQVASVRGVSEARAGICLPAIVDLDGVEKPIGGSALSAPDEAEPPINLFLIMRGSSFSPDRKWEVVVSEMFAKARGLSPGDFISLTVSGQKRSFFIAGTAISSEFMYLTPPGGIVPEPADYGIFWMKKETLEELSGYQGACNSVVGMLTPEAKRSPKAAIDEMSRRLQPYGLFNAYPRSEQPSDMQLSAELSGLASMATMVPTIFMGVAALVLNVVMLRMAEQQRVVIGTLKALGVSGSAIYLHFLKFGLAAGVAGGALGVALGAWISDSLAELYSTIYTFPSLSGSLNPEAAALAVLVSTLFAAAGALRGVKAVAGLNPAEAMRPDSPRAGGKILLERFSALWTKLDFRWQMTLRGLFRSKARTAIGICAAALGASLVVLSLGMTDSLNFMVFFQFDKVQLSDATITLRDEASMEARLDAARLPGVVRAEASLDVPCRLVSGHISKRVSITGLMAGASLTKPSSLDGNAFKIPSSGLLLSRRLAELLEAKPGSTLTMLPVKGDRTPKSVQVAGVVDCAFGLPVYADFDWLNHVIGAEASLNSLQLALRQTPEERKEFFRAAKEMSKLSSLALTATQKDRLIGDFVAKMKGITVIEICFAAVIFFGSILNSTLISMSERRREIATFRVLGYEASEVGTLFFREIVIVNMLGTLVGLPLGWLLLKSMMDTFSNDMYTMPCVVSLSSWLLTPLLSLLFMLASYAIVFRGISAMDWAEALKMRE